ncbi:unnamed protein product, partial [Brachionus calyciflorus]
LFKIDSLTKENERLHKNNISYLDEIFNLKQSTEQIKDLNRQIEFLNFKLAHLQKERKLYLDSSKKLDENPSKECSTFYSPSTPRKYNISQQSTINSTSTSLIQLCNSCHSPNCLIKKPCVYCGQMFHVPNLHISKVHKYNVEHVIFDVRTLSRREKISDNYIFKQVLSLWSKKKVLVAKNAYYANGRESPKWNLDEFSKLGTQTAQIIDFTNKKKEATDTLQNFFSNFTIPGNVLKFSEWPKITTLKEASLELYNDYCAILPCKQFTSPTGNMNLFANLPVDCCPPDIGPKIFAGSKDSYTNLHIDISDSVNILFYANELEKDKKESLKEFLVKSNCDKLYIERLESETPGAIWHIFSDSDVPVISKYLDGAKFRTK